MVRRWLSATMNFSTTVSSRFVPFPSLSFPLPLSLSFVRLGTFVRSCPRSRYRVKQRRETVRLVARDRPLFVNSFVTFVFISNERWNGIRLLRLHEYDEAKRNTMTTTRKLTYLLRTGASRNPRNQQVDSNDSRNISTLGT